MTGQFSDAIDTEDKAAGTERAGGLCSLMAEATRDLHRQAERTGIIDDLIHRRATISAYTLFLRNLLPAYRALESGLSRHRRLAGVHAFAGTQLYRSDAIESDLLAIHGPGWMSELPLLPSAIDYVGRIERLSTEDPQRLIGHAYTRYFGDLSGGKILGKLISETFSLSSSALAFYRFEGIEDAQAFKETLRSILDREISSPETCDAIVDEAAWAFGINIQLSKDVQDAAAAI
jgi:heme oxygenase